MKAVHFGPLAETQTKKTNKQIDSEARSLKERMLVRIEQTTYPRNGPALKTIQEKKASETTKKSMYGNEESKRKRQHNNPVLTRHVISSNIAAEKP